MIVLSYDYFKLNTFIQEQLNITSYSNMFNVI